MKSHLVRYGQTAGVLRRHGLGALVNATGLDRWIPLQRGLLGHAPRDEPYATPEHLRLVLEQLGPVFVKLGQLLSTRPDLLPASYIAELSKLQDDAPPVGIDDIRSTIREELGADPEEVFETFDAEPLASASIGQAHVATTRGDGARVVVKVRRPGAVDELDRDLEILQNLAATASRRWEIARSYDVVGIAGEFAASPRSEPDDLREGRNAERFAANFATDEDVVIWGIRWETTTSGVLTLDFIEGIKINDLAALDAAGIDRHRLAKNGASLMLRMIFDDGFFHADPHPGNMFIQPGAQIALIDFGMVGEVGQDQREHLADFLVAITAGDPQALASSLLEQSVTKDVADREGLGAALSVFVSSYQARPLGEIAFGEFLLELLTLLRTHHLQLPGEMAQLFKVLLMAEGMAVVIDPALEMSEMLKPFAERIVAKRYSVAGLTKRFANTVTDLVDILAKLPRGARRAVDILDRSGFEVHLRAA